MEVIFIISGVFFLLLSVCWLIYRQSRSRSELPADLLNKFTEERYSLEDLYSVDGEFSSDFELGPVITTESDRTPDYSDDADYGDPEFDDAETPGQLFQEATHLENEYYSDEFAVEENAEDFNGEEVYMDDSSGGEGVNEIDLEDEHDDPGEIDEPFIEPTIGFEPKTIEDKERCRYREPHISELIIGEQTQISLRTTGINGSDINGSKPASVVPYIDVDESVEFPDLNGQINRDVDMLGWIPDDGSPVSRVDLLALIRSFGEKFDLPVLLYGKLMDSDAWVNFEEDNVSGRYADLMLCMQLMHRGKLITEQTWWRFFNMGEKIANALSRSFYPSLSLESAISESKRIATLVDNLNIQAILILESDNGSQLSGRTLEYLAREYQLAMLYDGRVFEKQDQISPNSAPYFTLTRIESDQDHEDGEHDEKGGLVLFCDLPCVSDPLDAFDQMVDFAWTLANRFPLTLVDELRQRVSARDIQTIRTHIESFVDDMSYCHITPGGEVAMRLFDEPNPYLKETDERDLANLTVNL